MKTIILAGGFGTRLSELTSAKPKPMVEIGGKPLLWHIMNIYASFGYSEFVVALGYKSELIKEYFLDFYSLNCDLSIDLSSGKSTFHHKKSHNWIIHLIDTGLKTLTGGRIKRLKEWIGNETFMMTYGDGLSDVNIRELVDFHNNHKKLATVTAVRPQARFGGLTIQDDSVIDFAEKNKLHEGWINGGFFVLEPEIFDYIEGDDTTWETTPLEQLTRDNQLKAFFHEGFWQPMDTLREYRLLESLWESGSPPWLSSAPKTLLKELTSSQI